MFHTLAVFVIVLQNCMKKKYFLNINIYWAQKYNITVYELKTFIQQKMYYNTLKKVLKCTKLAKKSLPVQEFWLLDLGLKNRLITLYYEFWGPDYRRYTILAKIVVHIHAAVYVKVLSAYLRVLLCVTLLPKRQCGLFISRLSYKYRID